MLYFRGPVDDIGNRDYEWATLTPEVLMKTAKQLSLFLENKPGTFAAVCEALADAGISIHALAVSEAVDHAVLRMVVDQPTKAIHLLGEHGVIVVERDVLMLTGRNRAGELATITRKLAENKVNIEYAYTATPPRASAGVMILRVNQPAKAARVLQGH